MGSDSSVDSATIDLIANYVKSGQCILFLGAAVHAGPPNDCAYEYAEDQRPPLGKSLSERLALASNLKNRYPTLDQDDLQRVALGYELAFGRQKLIEEIEQAVDTNKRPSPVLRALAALPFPIVMTTNYDRLFEKAIQQVTNFEKDPFISVYKPNVGGLPETTDDYPDGRPTPEKPFIVKIHGDTRKHESVVITDEDYIQFVMRMGQTDPYNPIPDTFRFFFKKWPTIFIGYSLMDYNLRLLFKTMRWNMDPSKFPLTYSIQRTPDPLLVEVWHQQRKYINFIAQDVWTFVPDLYRRVTGEDMPS